MEGGEGLDRRDWDELLGTYAAATGNNIFLNTQLYDTPKVCTGTTFFFFRKITPNQGAR